MQRFSQIAKVSSLLDVADEETFFNVVEHEKSLDNKVQVIKTMSSPSIIVKHYGLIHSNGTITKNAIEIIDIHNDSSELIKPAFHYTPWSYRQTKVYNRAKKMVDMTKCNPIEVYKDMLQNSKIKGKIAESYLAEKREEFNAAVDAAETLFCPVTDEKNFVKAIVQMMEDKGVPEIVTLYGAMAVAKSMQRSFGDHLQMINPEEPLFVGGFFI